MAYTPGTKNPGDLIKSEDWNETTQEVARLEADKVNKAGDAISGSLTIGGNVGIGTTASPEAKLHLFKPNVPSLQLLKLGNQNQPSREWSFDVDGSANMSINNEGNGTQITAMSINSTGNIGVGTSSPAQKLDVTGTVKATNFVGNGSGLTGVQDSSKVAKAGDTMTGTLNLPAEGLKVGGDQLVAANGSVGIGTTNPSWITGRKIMHLSSSLTPAYVLEDTGAGHESKWILFTSAVDGGLFIREGSSNNMYIHKSGNVGIGTGSPGTDKLDVRGRCYSSGGWQTTNADYAEYFESEDNTAIRIGTSVTFTSEGKIRPAKKGETPIGIVTLNSAVVGNSYKEWPRKYLRDEFGNLIKKKQKVEEQVPKKETVKKQRQKVEKKTITEKVTRVEVILKGKKYIQQEVTENISREIEEPLFEEVDLYDDTGKKKIGTHRIPIMEDFEEKIDVTDESGLPALVGSGQFVTEELPQLNPDYDESREYIPREDRPEWHCVGLLGQLPLRKGQPVADSWIKIKETSAKVELWLVK